MRGASPSLTAVIAETMSDKSAPVKVPRRTPSQMYSAGCRRSLCQRTWSRSTTACLAAAASTTTSSTRQDGLPVLARPLRPVLTCMSGIDGLERADVHLVLREFRRRDLPRWPPAHARSRAGADHELHAPRVAAARSPTGEYAAFARIRRRRWRRRDVLVGWKLHNQKSTSLRLTWSSMPVLVMQAKSKASPTPTLLHELRSVGITRRPRAM